MINWRVRMRNKLFLTTLISKTVVMIQAVIAGLVALGVVNLNLEQIDTWIKIALGIIDTILIYLSFLGVIIDPTTKNIEDSVQAMTYTEPK